MKNLPGLATFEFLYYDFDKEKFEKVVFRLTIHKMEWVIERNIDGVRVTSISFASLYNSRNGWNKYKREQDKAETNKLIQWLEMVNEKYVKC